MNAGNKTHCIRSCIAAVAVLFVFVTGALSSPSVTVTSGTVKKTLVEFFTGTWCSGCPYGAADLKELQKKMGNFVVISYHKTDPMCTLEGDSYINLVKVTIYPTAIIDRTLFPGYYQLFFLREDWEQMITEAVAVPPAFDITVTYEYDESTRTVTLDIAALALRDLTRKCRMNVIVTEDSLNYRQLISPSEVPELYPYYHLNVLRKAVTGTTGEPFIDSPAKQGETFRKSYSFPLADDIAAINANILVFIHETQSNNIGPVQQVVRFPVMAPQPVNAVHEKDTPKTFRLLANRPNPFNPSSVIRYMVAEEGPVELSVYNVLGRHIRTLVDDRRGPGEYSVTWDGRDENGAAVSGGVYFYRMRCGSQAATRKMLLLK